MDPSNIDEKYKKLATEYSKVIGHSPSLRELRTSQRTTTKQQSYIVYVIFI